MVFHQGGNDLHPDPLFRAFKVHRPQFFRDFRMLLPQAADCGRHIRVLRRFRGFPVVRGSRSVIAADPQGLYGGTDQVRSTGMDDGRDPDADCQDRQRRGRDQEGQAVLFPGLSGCPDPVQDLPCILVCPLRGLYPFIQGLLYVNLPHRNTIPSGSPAGRSWPCEGVCSGY